MNERDHTKKPSPEQLAAYVDDELSGSAARAVEAWLSEHPEAAAEVEEQRKLARLLESTAPAEPLEERWEKMLRHVQAALPTVIKRPTQRPRRKWWAAASLLATAAAVLIVLGWTLPSPRPDDLPPLAAREEPWPVLANHEVRIISMDDADRGALVVGEPPLQDPLAFLSKGDVTVDQMEKDEDGMTPHLANEGSAPPMIVSPVRPRPGN